MGSLAHEPRVSLSWVGLDLEISQELGHGRKKEKTRNTHVSNVRFEQHGRTAGFCAVVGKEE